MPRPALLALLAVIAGSLAFHAYRAEHPTTSYQSADERSYGKLALGIADEHTYGNGIKDPLHWPPGAPFLFAAGHALAPDAASAETYDIPAAYWLQALVSLGTLLAAFGIAALLAGAWAGVAAAALVGFYPPLILATGEQISEPLGAFFLTLAFLLFVVAARRGRVWLFAAGGVALGAAVLTRADLLPCRSCSARWWRCGPGGPAGEPAPRPRGRRRHPRRGAAGDRALERLRVRARGRVRAGHARSASALFVGTYLPGNGTTVGMKRALGAEAKRATRSCAAAPTSTSRRARCSRWSPPAIPTSSSTRRSRWRRAQHLALRPRGPGRLRRDDAQQGPADVVALRARRRAPHLALHPRLAHPDRAARVRRAGAGIVRAAARCCWRRSSLPR